MKKETLIQKYLNHAIESETTKNLCFWGHHAPKLPKYILEQRKQQEKK